MSSPTTIQIINAGVPVPGVFITQNSPGQPTGGLFQISLSTVIPNYATNDLYKIFISGGSGGPGSLQPFSVNFLGDNTTSEVDAYWAYIDGTNINGGIKPITQQFPPSNSRIYFFQQDSTYITRTELPNNIVRYVYDCPDGALFNMSSFNCNLWLTYIPIV